MSDYFCKSSVLDSGKGLNTSLMTSLVYSVERVVTSARTSENVVFEALPKIFFNSCKSHAFIFETFDFLYFKPLHQLQKL